MKSPNLVSDLARHITLRQLQVFESVARNSSFTRAAEELFLAQPTVSMQLKKLADTVGLPLFEQRGIRIHLTEAGNEVYTICQEIFDNLTNLETKISDIKGVKCGHLRLAIITSSQYLVPDLLGQFGRLHPDVDFSLSVENREHILERLTGYEDDLCILGEPPPELDVISYPFIPNPLVAMASCNHPLAGVPNIPLKRFLEEPFIHREPGSGTRDAINRLFASKGLETPAGHMELASNEALKQAVVAELGVSILSMHSLALEGTSGPIAILDVQGLPIHRYWYLVHPKNKKLSPVTLAFLEFAKMQGQKVANKFNEEMEITRKAHMHNYMGSKD